jgi:hypothetical protein
VDFTAKTTPLSGRRCKAKIPIPVPGNAVRSFESHFALLM